MQQLGTSISKQRMIGAVAERRVVRTRGGIAVAAAEAEHPMGLTPLATFVNNIASCVSFITFVSSH